MYGIMDQRTICLCLDRKLFSAQAIHDELVQILGSDAIAYSTASFYLRASRYKPQNAERDADLFRRLSTTQVSKPLMKPCSR
jgi:hypothetical protein